VANPVGATGTAASWTVVETIPTAGVTEQLRAACGAAGRSLRQPIEVTAETASPSRCRWTSAWNARRCCTCGPSTRKGEDVLHEVSGSPMPARSMPPVPPPGTGRAGSRAGRGGSHWGRRQRSPRARRAGTRSRCIADSAGPRMQAGQPDRTSRIHLCFRNQRTCDATGSSSRRRSPSSGWRVFRRHDDETGVAEPAHGNDRQHGRAASRRRPRRRLARPAGSFPLGRAERPRRRW
jgi:hypothetical protein